MANRRMIGEALQSSSQMVRMYLSHILDLERQKQAQAASSAAAQQGRDDQFDLTMIPKMSSGEFNPANLTPPQRTRIGEKVNLDTLYPSDEMRSGKVVGDKVTGADSLAKLPSDNELTSLLRAVGINPDPTHIPLPDGAEGPTQNIPPAVQQAMDARKSAYDKLYANQPVTSRNYIPDNDPFGREFQEFVPNSDLAARGGTPIEKTPQQQAAFDVAKGQGTLDFDRQKAEGIAQSTSIGQNKEDWLNPAVFAKRLELAREQALGSALASGQVALAQKAAENFTKLQRLIPTFDRIFELSSKVNIYAADNYSDRIGTVLEAALQTNPDAAEQGRIVKSLARQLANDPNWGGNVGAQSEADALAMEGRFPRVGDSDDVAGRLIAALKSQLLLSTTQGVPILQLPVDPTLQQLYNRPLGGGGVQPQTPAPISIDPNTFLPTGAGR